MTLFARRSSPKMSARRLQGGSGSKAHVKPVTMDKETTPTPLDDDLFADINWPDEDEEKYVSDDESPGCAVSDDGLGEDGDSPEDSIPQTQKDGKNKQIASSGISSSSGTSPSDRSGRDSTTTPPDSQGNGRFPKEVRSVLRTWYHEHRDNPYPTSEEKDELVAKTGLKRSQISLWLANARRKTRSKHRTDPKSREENSIWEKSFDELNPMDRWKVLPIENEPVAGPLYATIDATYRQRRTFFEIQLYPIKEDPRHQAGSNQIDCDQSTTVASNFDNFWQQSMASYETGGTYETGPSLVHSGTSVSDTTGLSYPSLNSSRHASRDRRRRRCHAQRPPKPATSAKERAFHCTFCPHSFSTKHDWQRHEKSQHLSLEKWICCLNGGTIDTPSGPVCAFCDHPEPDASHLETHNYSACQVKDLDERTFYRKDHFQQHLRLTHDAKFNPIMNAWREEVANVKSRCGFCNATFNTWAARADHLAAHFKCHAKMQDWVGDWGFEPHVSALVERAGGHPAVGASLAAAAAARRDAAMMPPPPLSFGAGQTFVPPQPQPAVAYPQLTGGNGLGKPPPALTSMPLMNMNMNMDQQSFPIDPALLPYTTSFSDAGLLAIDNGPLPDLNGVDVLDWANLGV